MVVPFHIARQWLIVGASVVGTAAAAGIMVRIVSIYRRPSAEVLEERRRRRLADSGRIVDGSVIGADPVESTPQKIVYSYRVSGVTYECSQDVSTLPTLVQNLRLDYPVQVRYARENPADSIVVSETWNGLWTNLWYASSPHKGKLLEKQQQG